MIVSYKHKYIFVHCRKAAGSSVKASLARDLGPKDIQIGSMHDSMKLGIQPNRQTFKQLLTYPANMHFAYLLLRTWSLEKSINHPNKISYTKKFGFTPEHPTAEEISFAFSEEWDSFSKFCVVRNSFSKAVSDYHWRTRSMKEKVSFKEFLEAIVEGKSLGGVIPENPCNWEMYTINDKVVMDYIIDFDNLVNSLGNVLGNIGVQWDGWLPNAKKIRNNSDWKKLYDSDSYDLVKKIYGKEIDYFKFEI